MINNINKNNKKYNKNNKKYNKKKYKILKI